MVRREKDRSFRNEILVSRFVATIQAFVTQLVRWFYLEVLRPILIVLPSFLPSFVDDQSSHKISLTRNRIGISPSAGAVTAILKQGLLVTSSFTISSAVVTEEVVSYSNGVIGGRGFGSIQ